jgi:hypothetical protein
MPSDRRDLRRNLNIFLTLCAAHHAATKVKPLICLPIPDRQVPKVLVPCSGGHGIAFVYPSIPCPEVVCFSDGAFPGKRRTGNQHSKYDMKKNTSRATGEAAVEGSKHEY